MNSAHIVKLLITIFLVFLVYFLERKRLFHRLLYSKYESVNKYYFCILLVILDIVFFDLKIEYFILTIALIFSVKYLFLFPFSKNNSKKSYSELSFILFRLSLILRTGQDLVGSLNEATYGDNFFTKNIRNILLKVDQGLDFQTACKNSISDNSDSKYKQFVLQIMLAYNSGASISKVIEEIAYSASEHHLDDIDREIAKLPIKATFPLLMIFSGALILMLTPPLVNLISFSKEIVIK